MTEEQIAQIEERLHYSFLDKRLLVTAFTHSSYANELKTRDNERMEFLGDAILDMVVSEYLFERFKNCSVGVLSTMRSNIVSAKALRPIVDELDILIFLQVSNGSNIKNVSKKIESNLYEAIVAAIYLDGGFASAKSFILRTLLPLLSSMTSTEQKDGKTLLQEYCSKHKMSAPRYVLAGRIGKDNNPTYKCDLYINDEYVCSGEGTSKKNAEQEAAEKIVTKWRIN